MIRFLINFFLVSILISCNQSKTPIDSIIETIPMKIIVGTYTQKEGHVDGKAEGIYTMEVDQKDGSLKITNELKGIVNPSFVIINSNGNSIYAVSEVAGSTPIGQVFAFRKNTENQEFRKISELSTHGNAPCYLHIDEIGKRLYVVNYMGGIINYKINTDGSLSDSPQVITYDGGTPESARQEGPHPHMIQRFKDFIYVSDLGTDQIITYSIDDSGTLIEKSRTETSIGGGPRHFAIHPTNNKLYVTNELNLTLQSFDLNAQGLEMTSSQTISLHNGLIDEIGHSGSAIKIHPSGKYLYAGMRAKNGSKDNSIQQFTIDSNGILTHESSTYTQGSVPRDFEISPDGKFLLVANQNSDNIVTFKLDHDTGHLSDSPKISNVRTPVSIKFF